ncbi:hypothetical protein IWX92DRAFT_158903 [Phyllosticta citricarpa]
MTHLLQLSNELIDLIVANLERQDAFALRSCCRTLCDATWSHCAKTWFSKFIIYGFGNGVLRHAQVAAQPRVCRSIKHLCLILDPVEDLSSRSEFLCNTLRAHFSSMPNLVTLTVRRTKSDVHWKKRDWKWYRDHEKISEHILQVFINLLVTPNQLRTLEIKSSDFRGWSDGLLKLEALAVMARAAPLIQTNFASLVSLTISLNTSTDNDPDCRCALADFVKAIPTLEELTIAGSKRPRAPPPPMIFRALCMATLGDKKLPRLKRLRLRFFPIEFEPLMDFVLGHISTLTRFEMDHVLLLESRTPLDPIPRSTQVVSDWNFFMDDLDDFAFVHPCTWDLMWDRPERAQRIVLQLWEKTPVRLEKVRRAIEEGRDPPRFE